MSRLSLLLYLSSYLTDLLLYPLLNRSELTFQNKLMLFIPVVCFDFILAAALAFVTELGVRGLTALLPQGNHTEKS